MDGCYREIMWENYVGFRVNSKYVTLTYVAAYMFPYSVYTFNFFKTENIPNYI